MSKGFVATLALTACVALGGHAAQADPASVPAADPCGDTNLLATTDRPTFGTNPCVVKPQAAIAEFGYRNVTSSGPNGASVSSAPNNRDRIGLFPHVELVIDAPSAVRTTSRGAVVSGDSNLGTGLKYEFGYFGNFVHGVAAEAVYPTGSAAFSGGLPSFNGSYQIGGGIVKNVGFNLTLGFNSFSSPNPAGGKNVSTTAFEPTFILGGAIAPATKLNVEIAGNSSGGPGTGGRYFGNVFLQHQFTRNVLIDIEATQRFTVIDGTHSHYVGVGGSLKL